VKIDLRTRRLLLFAAGAFALVGAGIVVSAFVLDEDDRGIAAIPASTTGDARQAGGGDYSLRDVSCTSNLFDEPLAKGDIVNIADSNKQFRVSVVFRDGDREIGHGMELLDEITPGESEYWAVWVEKEFHGDGLDCDIRVEDASA